MKDTGRRYYAAGGPHTVATSRVHPCRRGLPLVHVAPAEHGMRALHGYGVGSGEWLTVVPFQQHIRPDDMDADAPSNARATRVMGGCSLKPPRDRWLS